MKQKRTALLVALAVMLVMSVGIVPAWAYFTSNDQAIGGADITNEPTTVPHEKYGAREKSLEITNTGKNAVYIRAKAFASEALEISGDGWTQDGDWYYYDAIVEPGEVTKTLTVKITFPEGATEEDEYNVDLVYESTPVLYDADGNPTADWEHILDMVEEGGN